VHATARGYGNAYHAGMSAARGRVLVMADADGTYPMEAIPALVAPVLAGDRDMVIGSRLRGAIAGGAMPWTHRYIGNPILTGILNRFFGVTVSDAHSGMRAIAREAYFRLGLTTPGMEYASEMIVHAARARLRIEETPIDYRERIGASKLQRWPDGWRHLKFLLLASPNHLFLLPGVLVTLLGLLLLVPLTFGDVVIGPLHLYVHPMLVGSALTIAGLQMLEFGVLVRACSPVPLGVEDHVVTWLHRHVTIEKVLAYGAAVFLGGTAIGAAILIHWALTGFGPIYDVRQGIAALTMCTVGTQTIFGGFLYAFFLPAQFGGGVAPAATRRHAGVDLVGHPDRAPDGATGAEAKHTTPVA
jgi:hypothetical protein